MQRSPSIDLTRNTIIPSASQHNNLNNNLKLTRAHSISQQSQAHSSQNSSRNEVINFSLDTIAAFESKTVHTNGPTWMNSILKDTIKDEAFLLPMFDFVPLSCSLASPTI